MKISDTWRRIWRALVREGRAHAARSRDTRWIAFWRDARTCALQEVRRSGRRRSDQVRRTGSRVGPD